jgi:hypothetical protein
MDEQLDEAVVEIEVMTDVFSGFLLKCSVQKNYKFFSRSMVMFLVKLHSMCSNTVWFQFESSTILPRQNIHTHLPFCRRP